MKICGRVGVKIYKTTPEFWAHYQGLPRWVQHLADEKLELLKRDPRHPSLNLKKIGACWVARVGINYRTLAREEDGILVWFWIGKHTEAKSKTSVPEFQKGWRNGLVRTNQQILSRFGI